MEKVWPDRTQEYRYRLRGKEPAPGQFATLETLTFDPLPRWKDLPPEEYRQRTAEQVAEIEEGAREAKESSLWEWTEAAVAHPSELDEEITTPLSTQRERRLTRVCGRRIAGSWLPFETPPRN